MLFAVANDAAVGELDVAGVPASSVGVDRHQRWLCARSVRRGYGLIVDIEVGVPIKDEEPLSQIRKCADQRPAGAHELRAIENVGYVDTELGAVADGGDDLFPEMTQAIDDAPNVVKREQAKLVISERLACDIDQDFGNFIAQRPEPRCQPAGQNCDW